MRRQMWFGTREHMQWVKPPAVNMPSSKAGWASKTDYLNGGTYVRRSTAAHKEYTLTWNLVTRDEVRPITDYADRVYGDGLIYWCDPFVMEYNALPQWLATPAQALDDGPILTGGDERGEKVTTAANDLGYPTNSIRYTVDPAITAPTVWIPCPPGHTVWLGAHGQTGTGGQVLATPTLGPAATGAPVPLQVLSVTDAARMSTSFSSTDCNGVLIGLGGEGTVTLSGLMVQILRTGVAPKPGGFISGQGHSGCQFVEQPQLTPYSAAVDAVGLVADLAETGGWM